MDYYNTLTAIIVFIETRLQSGFTYAELEKATGFSLPHIRAIFAGCTGKSLSRYILERKISNASFDITHSDESILSIAVKYNFSSHDVFTRAFHRITGHTPQEFRKNRISVGSVKLADGVYGVSERMDMMSEDLKKCESGSEVVLYGVPKVGYGIYGSTPYPICVKAIMNYLGEDVDYDDVIVGCGAAFRLTWDETSWFGGNVDICFTFDDYGTPYRLAVEGLGRKYTELMRGGNTTKQEFIDFIKAEIDSGRPCIATGIIGPPEACIITGYRDNGNTLLGWNFFQDRPEFAGGNITFDECGYFISSSWWENPDTGSVISIGEKILKKQTVKDIISNAVEVLSGRRKDQFAKGIMAYDAWKKVMSDEREFPKNAVLPLLAERLMCQWDAISCLTDGRSNAESYFKKLTESYSDTALYLQISQSFGNTARYANEMSNLLGNRSYEEQMKALADPEIRRQTCTLIDKCKESDEKALALLKELHQTL